MPQKVKIEIYGQSYNVAGDLDEAYVEKLARYVDGKMREVAQATQLVDTTKVAVLAAMAIADELHSEKPEQPQTDPRLRERAEKCLLLVEQALKQIA